MRTFTRQRLNALAVLFLAVSYSVAQTGPEPPKMLTSADLLSDVGILERAYKELHPGLYRYNTREQIDANFALLKGEFSRDQTLGEAYLAFSLFTAKLKCGHSYPNFFNQTKETKNALFLGQNKLPFHFRWLDGKMIVVRNFSSDKRITAGTEIVSINGTPAKEVLAKLMTIARADGSNDAKRVSYLEVLGNDRIEAFDVYLPLFYPQTNSKFALKIKPVGPKTMETTVDGLTYEQRLSSMNPANKADENAQAFDLRYLDDKTAVLSMPGWALYDSKWNWRKFIEDTMDELIAKNIANLIVDIRPNEGGLDVGDVLISRLIDRDISLSQTKRFVRYQKAPADLVPFLDTWDRSFDNWGTSATDLKDGFYTLKRYDDNANGSLIKPNGKRFAGRVFVLVGATNSSATFQFARTIKHNKLGTLVGQPTGGNQRGINGGAFYFLRLPKTKIEIDLPLIGQFPVGNAPDAGIEPDVYVKPTAADIAAGRDPELEAVKELIKKRK